MPGRDADVVEAVVGAQRVGGIHLVAGDAARLAVEQLPPRLRLGRNRLGIAVEEPPEGRIDEHQRPLEGREGPLHVGVVHLPAVGLLEGLRIVGVAANDLQDGVFVGHSHLDRIEDRHARLAVQAGRPPVPKEHLKDGRVERRRRVSLAQLAVDPLGDRSPIGEPPRHVMTGRAGHGAVAGESRVEVELPPQRDPLGGQLVVFGDEGRPDHGVETGRRLVAIAPGLQFLKFRQLVFHGRRAVPAPRFNRRRSASATSDHNRPPATVHRSSLHGSGLPNRIILPSFIGTVLQKRHGPENRRLEAL